MNNNQGLKESLWGEDKTKKCANPSCKRMLVSGLSFFYDFINDLDYCSGCGKCLRYSRKKAEERGEPVEEVKLD